MSVLFNVALKYLESHPDQIEKLVIALIDWAVSEIGKKTAASK